MDIGYQFAIAVITAFVSWLLTFILHKNIKAWITSIGAAIVVVPIAVIYLTGIFKMQSVSDNITAMNEIANNTTVIIIDYITNNIESILISDLAGVFVGSLIGFFTGSRNDS